MMLPTKMETSPYDDVVFLGHALQVGETQRYQCPKCHGGQSSEASFAISKSLYGRIHYCCFRAKCQWRGTISAGVHVGDRIELPFAKRLRIFDRPTEELTSDQIAWYREKFGLSPDSDVRWCDSTQSYAYKVFGPNGQRRGWQLRDYRPGATLRANNYVERDEPFISWYFPDKPEIGGVVIVEDIPSARKVSSCGIASVALLGGAIDYERAYEIAALAENFVILALDRGTLPKQIEYRQRYECLWGSVEIWQLQEDLKYVNRKRIREAIYDGKSDFVGLLI